MSGLTKELEALMAYLANRKEDARIAGSEIRSHALARYIATVEEALRSVAAASATVPPRKMYPIMGGPSVPYEVMVPHESQAKRNHSQSIDRLAERGGLSPGEAWLVVNGIKLTCAETKEQWETYSRAWHAFADRINLHYDELDKLRAIVATRPEERPSQDVAALAHRVALDVSELPDRNSPDDWPEAMLVTEPELTRIIVRHFMNGVTR